MNLLDFKKRKNSSEKISMVTCYDAWSAKVIETSPIDCVLVGDSLAMVVHGFDSTLHATTEMMALHTAGVRRGLKTKFLVADMPFLTFRKGINPALDCVENLMVAGANAVKLEGVWGHEEVVSHIVQSGVPVMGHIGLTPQSVQGLGGFRVQGKSSSAADDLIKQALKLQQLGCFALVIECVPASLGAAITEALEIPTIGIGAGINTDGQVLVLQDLLGFNQNLKPKFVRPFLDGENLLQTALTHFHQEIQEKTFPLEQESYL
jgi:3-methyl-2-oxobutanoate hydroxymethyltransferase